MEAGTATTVVVSGTGFTNIAGTELFESEVTLTADDGTTSTSFSFNVIVTSVQDDPVVANPLEDQTATEDVRFTYQVPANAFMEPDNETLTYDAEPTNLISKSKKTISPSVCKKLMRQ